MQLEQTLNDLASIKAPKSRHKSLQKLNFSFGLIRQFQALPAMFSSMADWEKLSALIIALSLVIAWAVEKATYVLFTLAD